MCSTLNFLIKFKYIVALTNKIQVIFFFFKDNQTQCEPCLAWVIIMSA